MPNMNICPKCKRAGMHLWMGGYISSIYECGRCGYRGVVSLEDGIKKKFSKTKKKA